MGSRLERCVRLLGERLARAVAAEGWCSKQVAAQWRTSRSISWKDAATALLPQDALLPYRFETPTLALTALPVDDEPLEKRLDGIAAAAERAWSSDSLGSVAYFYVTVQAAVKALGLRRNDLRATLLAAVREGHRLRNARLDHRNAVRFAYDDAVKALAPDADVAPFIRLRERLSVSVRNLGSCAALFDAPNGARSRNAAVLQVAV